MDAIIRNSNREKHLGPTEQVQFVSNFNSVAEAAYLWCHVTKCACRPGHILRILSLNTSDAKIGDLKVTLCVKQHVFSFDVPMHYLPRV
jgi:hypothetical protein